MKRAKIINFVTALIAVFALTCLTTGCDERKNTAEQKQAAATKRLLNEANNKIGMPNIKQFQQKKLMRLIQEQCDREDLICYAYLQSDYTGELIFIGKCVGYGVPFSAQFTNPEALTLAGSVAGHRSWQVMPQADPNGLYMPTSSSATWLMMIDPETKKPRPVYFEPTITVSPFKLPAKNVK
jgi:hypothetical protein